MWLRHREHQFRLVHLIIMDPKPTYFSLPAELTVKPFATLHKHSCLGETSNLQHRAAKQGQAGSLVSDKEQILRVCTLFISSYTCLIQVIRQ